MTILIPMKNPKEAPEVITDRGRATNVLYWIAVHNPTKEPNTPPIMQPVVNPVMNTFEDAVLLPKSLLNFLCSLVGGTSFCTGFSSLYSAVSF
jgi:hypothetical protein